MIQLDCIEDGCSFKTQELPFENAERVLQMHLDRKHPPGAPPVQMMPPTSSIQLATPRPAPSVVNLSSIPPPSSSPSFSPSSFGTNDLNSRFVYMVGFKPQVYEAETALKSAACPGKINLVENEAGKFTGEVIIKVNSEEDKNYILNIDFPDEYGHISMKEVGLDAYYKLVKKTESEAAGRNVYIRLKGMEWTATEEDVRKFLISCSIDEILMTKTPTGRPTGEAYLQLQTEADTQLAMKQNRQYLGRRFVIIEEVFEDQYLGVRREMGQ